MNLTRPQTRPTKFKSPRLSLSIYILLIRKVFLLRLSTTDLGGVCGKVNSPAEIQGP